MYKCILKWTKYIEVDCYFIREKVLLTSCINTNDQPADILNLTKSLRGTHFGFICDKLGALNLFENYSISLISCRKTKFLVTFCLFCIITFFSNASRVSSIGGHPSKSTTSKRVIAILHTRSKSCSIF